MPRDEQKTPAAGEAVRAGEWTDRRKLVRRRFPHGPAAGTALRLACTREAFADLAQHAKESLRAEVCGVLIGETCEDDDGTWVDVRAVIRGAAASQGAAHVTFTQETWTQIHQERESRHPKLGIVGWYHSHPGFGVEFSEMDVFIHRNFFSAPAQVALVTDPVSGEDAACINTDAGVRYLDRLWVDGRERALRRPATADVATPATGPAGERGTGVEARLSQLLTSLDEMNERISRFYLTVGMVVVMGLVLWLGSTLWFTYMTRYDPPKAMNQFSMPIRVGDKDIMVRLEVVGWDVPPELNSIMMQVTRERIEAEEARRRERDAETAEKAKQAADKAKQAAGKAAEPAATGATP